MQLPCNHLCTFLRTEIVLCIVFDANIIIGVAWERLQPLYSTTNFGTLFPQHGIYIVCILVLRWVADIATELHHVLG